MVQPQWQLRSSQSIPTGFVDTVCNLSGLEDGHYAAQLLWLRGFRDSNKLEGFINCDAYQPTNPSSAFGQEIKRAIYRIQKARVNTEKVAIWGDFDADGITATSLLKEGLAEFLPHKEQLTSYIPNRFRESHGLNCQGIDNLKQWGANLIITCDTGSTNLNEIIYAKSLGIDLIITDHHTLPDHRPEVFSFLNPRQFAQTHPLYHLSGVAVAYKLIEALYLAFPHIPQNPLENLLDLVAIGLISDLVQLTGDCRYLAQKGIQQLQKQMENPTRPSVAYLLKLCKSKGDRPTDISFGIGPRINAISRIKGDASFCVELLTSKDEQRCQKLAEETNLVNTRRKLLQQRIAKEAVKKLQEIDLSTTGVIVLSDSQWDSGVLGLVANQIALEYARPTILLTTKDESFNHQSIDNLSSNSTFPNSTSINSNLKLARGSARSINNIDLYDLVKTQEKLLHRFGGHPYAAGLSLPVENIPIFTEAINQQLRKKIDVNLITPTLQIDLVVKVSELNKNLFSNLKILEPYGMGNPIPKLLIKNCCIKDLDYGKFRDKNGKTSQNKYVKFKIYDDSIAEEKGFPGIWWGHNKYELEENQFYDIVGEFDIDSHNNQHRFRLVDIRKANLDSHQLNQKIDKQNNLIDCRGKSLQKSELIGCNLLEECPKKWQQIQQEYYQATANSKKLALAYQANQNSAEKTWKNLVGIAKFLSKTNKIVTLEEVGKKLNISHQTLKLGLKTLSEIGFNYSFHGDNLQVNLTSSITISPDGNGKITEFLKAVAEEEFQKQYFCQVSIKTIQEMV